MHPSPTRRAIDAEPFHDRIPHHVHESSHAKSALLPPHHSSFLIAFVARAILFGSALVLSGCVENEREIQAVREAARIAEEARQEQAEQTRTFAELETTLSQERQSIDRERAQAAERHDEAAKSREKAIQAQREVNEAATRDRFLGQALFAAAPALLVAVALWTALRLANQCFQGVPESDSAIAEVLLLESHLKTVWYDPGLAARLVAESRRGLPYQESDEGDGEPDTSESEEGPDEDEDDNDETPEDPNEPRPF